MYYIIYLYNLNTILVNVTKIKQNFLKNKESKNRKSKTPYAWKKIKKNWNP
jgi:hypothetical protein